MSVLVVDIPPQHEWKNLKNCMVDSGASNIVTHFKIMEDLGLKVDIKHGRCRVIDVREVHVISTINAFPYKLTSYPDVNITMSVLVVEIPPQYVMLLLRKWSVALGGSL